LLACADECGVLRGFGTADLMILTGMSKDRIGYQISALVNKGFIRVRVPGITSSALFGHARQLIYLNLKRVDSSLSHPEVTIVSEYLHYRDGSDFKEAKNLFLGCKRILSGADTKEKRDFADLIVRKGLNVEVEAIVTYF